MMARLVRLVTKSGIITSNLEFYSGSKLHTFLRRVLFLRCSPLVLNKLINPNLFTNIVATLSIGPTHKTTGSMRHKSVNKIMFDFINNFKSISLADIGVSDGVSSLDIYFKVKSRLKQFYLLDKYPYFRYTKEKYGYNFYNTDGDLVYMQIGNALLLHVFKIFGMRIEDSNGKTGTVSFDNPLLKKENLKVEEFDLFKGKLRHKVNVVKCANVLNSPYFTNEQIFKALENINKSMLDGGYLFVIQNNRKYKDNIAMLVLQKKKDSFELVLNHNGHEISKLVEKHFRVGRK